MRLTVAAHQTTQKMGGARSTRAGAHPVPGEWFTVVQKMLTVVGPRGRRLTCVASTGGGPRWLVMAVESTASMAPDDILDDHSHKSVGSYEDEGTAIRAAESFQRAWLKGFRATKAKPCQCKEMPTRRKGAA